MMDTVISARIFLVAWVVVAVGAVPCAAHAQVRDITFPVQGVFRFSNDFAEARGGGTRAHEGVKLARIVALKQDLALTLAAHPIRIEAPIPGKSLVGIELPNISKSSVGLGSLLEDDQFQSSSKRLLVALGKGVTGKSYFADIAKMPHLLIAGTTGSFGNCWLHGRAIFYLWRGY
jgi:hypothetical protein